MVYVKQKSALCRRWDTVGNKRVVVGWSVCVCLQGSGGRQHHKTLREPEYWSWCLHFSIWFPLLTLITSGKQHEQKDVWAEFYKFKEVAALTWCLVWREKSRSKLGDGKGQDTDLCFTVEINKDILGVKEFFFIYITINGLLKEADGNDREKKKTLLKKWYWQRLEKALQHDVYPNNEWCFPSLENGKCLDFSLTLWTLNCKQHPRRITTIHHLFMLRHYIFIPINLSALNGRGL